MTLIDQREVTDQYWHRAIADEERTTQPSSLYQTLKKCGISRSGCYAHWMNAIVERKKHINCMVHDVDGMIETNNERARARRKAEQYSEGVYDMRPEEKA